MLLPVESEFGEILRDQLNRWMTFKNTVSQIARCMAVDYFDANQRSANFSKSSAQGPASIVRYHSGQVSMRVSPVRWVAHRLARQVAQWKTREG